MTGMPELLRQLDRVDAMDATRRHDTGDPMELAFERGYGGVPDDEDIDLILETSVVGRSPDSVPR